MPMDVERPTLRCLRFVLNGRILVLKNASLDASLKQRPYLLDFETGRNIHRDQVWQMIGFSVTTKTLYVTSERLDPPRVKKPHPEGAMPTHGDHLFEPENALAIWNRLDNISRTTPSRGRGYCPVCIRHQQH